MIESESGGRLNIGINGGTVTVTVTFEEIEDAEIMFAGIKREIEADGRITMIFGNPVRQDFVQ